MEYYRLNDCAYFRKQRTKQIDFETYITTDNMIPNRGGVVEAESLPDVKTVNKYLPNDILLSNIRPYFKKIWFSNREGGCSNDVLVITAKSEIYPKFLYYVLSDNNFFNYDYVTSKGTKMPRGTPNAIMKYLVPKINMLKQSKIVSILSAYDNLIEVNNKRIEALEQMAENLYKEWFVRFRFPGHETAEFVESRIGRIPSSFFVAKMQSVFEYYIGGGWGNDDEDTDFSIPAYVIRGTDFPHILKGDLSTCPLRFHKESNYSARQLEPNDIILEVSGGTAEQPVGRTLLVTKDIIERLGGKVICASFCKQVRVKETIISPIYFNYWMQFLYNTRIIDRFQLQSTGIINFQFDYFLRKGDVMLPPKEIMNEFDKRIKPIQNEISAIARQNENLIKQRDLLLPRLMSGKLEVCKQEQATIIQTKAKLSYDAFLSEFGFAARAKEISDFDLRAMYNAYLDDDATE